jgi:bla regulator protein BlaR1
MLPELFNHLWQSTLFAVVAGLLTLAFRNDRAQIRYWLWYSASLKFLVPFTILIGLGSRAELWTPAAQQTASQLATPEVSFRMEQIAQPFSGAPLLSSPPPAHRDWLPIAIFGVWACGFIGVALIRFRTWLRIRAAVRSSFPLHLPLPANVRCAPGLLEPGVVGLGVFKWSRPIVLLPAGIEQHLTPPQLEAVLAHELCHIRRRDNLFASVHMIVEALFWFLPRVWWLGARLVEERERACDEEVLRLGADPRVYAEGILNVCKLYVESPLVCVSGVGGSDIKKRIEAIMTNRIPLRLSVSKKLSLAIAGAAALAVPIAIGILNAPAIRAQSAPLSAPKFDVASIRSGCGGGRSGDLKQKGGGGAIPASSPGRLSVCGPLDQNMGGLIQMAYGRFANGRRNPPWAVVPVEGGPAWIHNDPYIISARAEGDASLELMQGPMLQALLEDRFQLKMHRETREVPIYALTIAKGGSKLQPFKEGTCVPTDFSKVPYIPDPAQKNCNDLVRLFPPPNLSIEAQGAKLEVVAFLIGLTLDRPVVDKTGLTGSYDLHMEFGRDQTTLPLPPPPPGVVPTEPLDPSGPSIFTAIQEQLGLKLEPTKGPREFLVIDRVERPSEN